MRNSQICRASCDGSLVVSLAFCIWGASTSPLVAQTLSPGEVNLLKTLDAESTKQYAALAVQIDGWRRQVAAMQQGWLRAEADNANVTVATDLSALMKTVTSAIRSAPRWQQQVAQLSTLEQELNAADRRWRTAQFDQQANPGLTEAAFRKKLREEVLKPAVERTTQQLDKDVFAPIGALRNPAKFFQAFAEGKLREWMQEPHAAADGDMVFRILPPPAKAPLFSENANLGIEIEYLPGKLTVQATGLYFVYDGGVPRPMLNKLRVSNAENLKGKVLKNLQQLGTEITPELKLPVQVTITQLPDFAVGGDGRRGAIEFEVEVGFLEGGLAKAKAQRLLLYPGNYVKWKEGQLEVTAPARPPIPLGTTPFALWTITGSYRPPSKEFSFGGKISTLTTPPETIALNVNASSQLPIQAVTFTGGLVLGGQLELQKLKGEIDFSTGRVKGSYTSGTAAMPIPTVELREGAFELKSERLMMDGTMNWFGLSIANGHVEFNFDDGSAVVAADSGLKLFGSDFSSTFQGEIESGFRRATMESVGSVEVSGIEPFGTISVTVTVRADSSDETPVEVEVKAFDPRLNFEYSVDNLGDCTLDDLRSRLQKRAVDSYRQLLEELAIAEKEVRKLAAQLDQKVQKAFGGAWRTDNPTLNALGSRLSTEFQPVSSALGAVGSMVSDAREGIEQKADDLKEHWSGILGI